PGLSSAYVQEVSKGHFRHIASGEAMSHSEIAPQATNLSNQALFFSDLRPECEEGLDPSLEKDDSRIETRCWMIFFGRKKKMVYIRRFSVDGLNCVLLAQFFARRVVMHNY
ncbi:hypothetical protein AVEN_125537-1, partial [Araneus ventricosus]